MSTSGEPAGLNFGQFSKIDASGLLEGLLDELDRRDRLPIAVTLRKHLHELLHAGPDDRVADIGCGTGKVVAELMESGVEAVGVDISEQAIRTFARYCPSAPAAPSRPRQRVRRDSLKVRCGRQSSHNTRSAARAD